MSYLSVSETAKKWGITDRSVRFYCESGRIPGITRIGRSWVIPEDAIKPERQMRIQKSSGLWHVLKQEKRGKILDGIYGQLQTVLTYNLLAMEGCEFNFEQIKAMFETGKVIFAENKAVLNIDDVILAENTFACVDMIIDEAKYQLSDKYIKKIHEKLLYGTLAGRRQEVHPGEYKVLSNNFFGTDTFVTSSPEAVSYDLESAINTLNSGEPPNIDKIIEFHASFFKVLPFDSCNVAVAQLLVLKECLKYDIVPFVIKAPAKELYFNAIRDWDTQSGYLSGICRHSQDSFKEVMDRFDIWYS